METIANLHFVYGVVEPKTIRNIPEGARARVRMRNRAFARVYVRLNGETRHYAIREEGDAWLLDSEFEQGRNTTISST